MLFLCVVFPMLCLHHSQRPRRMSLSPSLGQLWLYSPNHSLHEGFHTQTLWHHGLYLQWLCVLLLLWTVLMVPDQTRDEGKTPSHHSVQQQADLKIIIIFLTFIIFTVLSLKRSLSLSDHTVMSVLKSKTCLFCGCNHSFWSSSHKRWPEHMTIVVECVLHIVGVQL